MLIIFLAVNYFVVSVLVVNGNSMVPTLVSGQVYSLNKLTYETSTPRRGDIVAFYSPENSHERLVKRIIGLPGETVKINNGKVYINGQLLVENYLPAGTVTNSEQVVTLDSDQYFVMGDNRASSTDSRSFGPVGRNLIIGKVAS